MKFRRYKICLDDKAIGEWVAPEMNLEDAANGFREGLQGFLRGVLERALEKGAKLTAEDVSNKEKGGLGMTTNEEEMKVWIDLCEEHAKLLIEEEDYDSVSWLGKFSNDWQCLVEDCGEMATVRGLVRLKLSPKKKEVPA